MLRLGHFLNHNVLKTTQTKTIKHQNNASKKSHVRLYLQLSWLNRGSVLCYRKSWHHETSGVCRDAVMSRYCVRVPAHLRQRQKPPRKARSRRSPPRSRCGWGTGARRFTETVGFLSVPSEKHTRITAKTCWLYLKQSELYLKRGERRILDVVFEKKNKKEKKKKWPTRVCRFWDSPWPSWV